MSGFIRRRRILIPAILICASTGAFAQSSAIRAVPGSGGVHAANATMRVAGTLGQPVIGTVAATTRAVGQGFWYAGAASAVASVPARNDAPLRLYCSPNPVTGDAHIGVTASDDLPLKLSLHDMLGREVRSILTGERTGGTHTIELDTDGLPAGRYRLVLTSGANRTDFPITVLR